MAEQRMRKSRNGENRYPIISINFNLEDPEEAAAFSVAQKLARPHGRRKRILIAFLLALSKLEERTGSFEHAENIAEVLATSRLWSPHGRPV